MDNFPEIMAQTKWFVPSSPSSPAMQLDRMKGDEGEGEHGHEAGDVVASKTVVGLRERRDRAVKGVTRLLEGVLETLQLYQGAPSESDPPMVRPDQEEDAEVDRRARWERNGSLVELKAQLTRWLRGSGARIPRISRDLSFSTLSEGEMAVYLREWKALQKQQQQQQQNQQRKRKSAPYLPYFNFLFFFYNITDNNCLYISIMVFSDWTAGRRERKWKDLQTRRGLNRRTPTATVMGK